MAFLTQLQSILGDRITDDELERRPYARDLAPLPSLLVRPFFRTLPDAVARPRSAEELRDVLRHGFLTLSGEWLPARYGAQPLDRRRRRLSSRPAMDSGG